MVRAERKDKITKVIHNERQTNPNEASLGKQSIKNKAL
jgi:hypothetical protein